MTQSCCSVLSYFSESQYNRSLFRTVGVCLTYGIVNSHIPWPCSACQCNLNTNQNHRLTTELTAFDGLPIESFKLDLVWTFNHWVMNIQFLVSAADRLAIQLDTIMFLDIFMQFNIDGLVVEMISAKDKTNSPVTQFEQQCYY